MADKKKKRKVAGTDIDWYLISIDRLKQIGLIILVILLGGGAFWFYTNNKGNPKANAESAISDARAALNALASSPQINAHRPEFDRAQKKLDDANTHFNLARYAEAQGAAVESQTISRGAISGSPDRESDAQFLTIEGEVQFQKSSTSDWKRADVRTPLSNGDWVKTGDGASAELIFSNNSVYTIGPNALLEIYAQVNPATSKRTNAVSVEVGPVEVATTDDQSSVRTPGSNVTVDSESTTQVRVDNSKATAVVATKGSASVASQTGGPAVKIASGEKVTATPQGTLSPVKKLVLPPALMGPADNQVFPLSPGSQVEFKWDAQEGATGYQLQVSRSRLFTGLEINSRRTKTGATAKVTSEGAFYWRVASLGPDGDVGPFSGFRRFRVSGGARGPSNISGDTTPPKLELKPPYPVGGGFFIIEGTTDPGSTVFINEEEVDVESNGHFKKIINFAKLGPNTAVIKAVSPAGTPTVKSQSVIVEE